MRYNATYHRQADKIAIEHGFEFAVYMGHYRTRKHNCLAFIPHYNTNRNVQTSGFHYILLTEKGGHFYTHSEPPKDFPDYDYLKKGRAILDEIKRKFFAYEFANEEERLYCRDIFQAVNKYSYDVPIPEEDMCLFLQEGKRLGRAIEFVGDEINEHIIDSWINYFKLKE